MSSKWYYTYTPYGEKPSERKATPTTDIEEIIQQLAPKDNGVLRLYEGSELSLSVIVKVFFSYQILEDVYDRKN